MKEVYESILNHIKNENSLEELLRKTDLNETELLAKINYLKQKGYMIEKDIDGNGIKLKLSKGYTSCPNLQLFTQVPLKIMLMSDTHLGHKNDRIDLLNKLYAYAKKRKIKHLIHLGDLIEGTSTIKEERLKHDTIEKQLRYFFQYYPKNTGISTVLVRGNHEAVLLNSLGINFETLLDHKRLDMLSLKTNSGIIHINNRNILFFHPYDYNTDDIVQDSKYYKTHLNIDAYFKGHHHRSRFYKNDGTFAALVPALINSGNGQVPGAYEVEFIPGEELGSIDKMIVKPLLLEPCVMPITEIHHEFKKKDSKVFKDVQKTLSRTDKFNNKYGVRSNKS